MKITTEPKSVFSQYKKGTEYKASIGDKGIFEQSKINERFYVGDQWHGANCGNDRPLVRRNIIKRIADYKLSSITSAPIAVNYSADGVPDNTGLEELKTQYQDDIKNGMNFVGETDEAEISIITSILSDYFATTAERVKFDAKKEKALRNAYISGTGIAYTYWDNQIETGLYADTQKNQPIKGDIAFEILDVENVVFGDPNCVEVQKQPYIIISQRIDCDEVKREARRNRISAEDIENIKPDKADSYEVNAGTRGEEEPTDSNRVTVLTKLYKEWDKEGTSYKVMCVKVCEKSYVRKPWDTGLRLYPLAKMCWTTRYSSAYGDSEITYQIPNQIAINRATSAEIWAIMTAGMPKTVVNGDTVADPLTNNPGEIIKVFGTNEDVAGAIRHVSPPVFSGQLINALNDLANNTLADSGANDAALGNIRPDNAAAIIQMREAALQPMQLYQNAFYDFIEDIARIWVDFWLNLYGNRRLKVENKDGVYYMPFDPDRYKNLLITAKIDVGSNPVWSIPTTVSILDSLYANQLINKMQYLERIPNGLIPDKTSLLKEAREEAKLVQEQAMMQQMMATTPVEGNVPPDAVPIMEGDI
jgi:hypothetical protein